MIRNVNLSEIDFSRLTDDVPLLLLLVASSFVESGANMYTRNLLAHFADDLEVAAWLKGQWEPEELEHGRALHRYVAHAWPEFDWQRAFDRFIADYSDVCQREALEPRHGLEMAARCIVETGTAALYRAIYRYVEEPALRQIVGDIANDEIGHYKHFYRYFRKYQRQERNSRISILAVLMRRSIEFRSEDADFGLRHAYDERCRSGGNPEFGLDELKRRVSGLIKNNLPVGMAVKMWIKPLRLPTTAARIAQRLAPMLVQRLVF